MKSPLLRSLPRKITLIGLYLALAALTVVDLPAAAECTNRAELNSYERAQFVEVAGGKRSEVYAQFLAAEGCGDQMLDALTRLGAKIDFVDKSSGYALVTVSRTKLLVTLDIPGIAYAYTVNSRQLYSQDPIEEVSQAERKAEPVPHISIPFPRVATVLAKDGPYFAAEEIGLPELWKGHPEADGRGIRVAVVDGGFDLLHPALMHARDATGNIVVKVGDLQPSIPSQDGSRVSMELQIQTDHGTFDAVGRKWIAPEDGAYRFGIFTQKLVLDPRDTSNANEVFLSVGVLWDEEGGRVWVDTNGDGSFRDQRALGDYGVTHDVDWFGAKTSDRDDRIPFGIKVDPTQKAVYLRIGGRHGALVAGPLAANKLTGGLFDGAAPSVQIVDASGTVTVLMASIVRSFARPDVDIVSRSGGLGREEQSGAENFERHVLERMITIYKKPIATVSDAVGTIRVEDYAGAEMLRRNRQVEPPYGDSLNAGVPFLADGLVNVVVAPSANLVTLSRYMPFESSSVSAVNGAIYLPPSAPDGYGIGDNPSPTITVVSGVLADLISEARREHVPYDAERLNNAIFTGTKLLDGFPLSQQGYGLVNAAQSWDQLSKMAQADDPNNPDLTSFTFSRVESDKRVVVQGFQADLVQPGEKVEGELWVTRHGGYAEGRKYTFALRGNDGTYTLLDHTATLVRDKPVRVRFRTNGSSGWQLVFLELRDDKADVVMEDVPLSVRVPEPPERIAPGIEEYQSTIPPLRSENKYVRVGKEVQAARYVMQIPYTGPQDMSRRSFPGFGSFAYKTQTAPPGEPVNAAHSVGPMETLQSLVLNDEPGTQEICWSNRGGAEYATQSDGRAPDVPIHATLTVMKYAVGIRKDANGALAVTNKLADIDGKVEIYDATVKTAQLLGAGPHASGDWDRTLPAGIAQWRMQVTSDSRSNAPADVYLIDCSGKDGCYVVAQQQISATGSTIVIDKPDAGNWKIVVRSRGQVSHSVIFSVREALLVPTPTPIEASDANHASGATWTLALPTKRSDADYAAFRIAGTAGVESEKNGLVIAVTPLDPNAP